MKKVKLNVLEFRKQAIINLNSSQMIRVYGGTNPLDPSIADPMTIMLTANPNNDLTTGANTNNPGNTNEPGNSTNGTNTQTGAMSVFSRFCPPVPPDGL